jgi:uncharacterized glyoxalase superfamily protein PhnB
MRRTAAITPVLRYRDAATAARWLCEAFGFQEHDRTQDLGGSVRYVSLRLGDSIVLVRPVANSVVDDLMVQPAAIGGANTQICYLTVADVAGHHARAEGAGAKVELEPQDDGLGGRFYTCRDLEGHLWSFGTHTYGVADDAASAFEPAEVTASRSSTPIAPLQRHVARQAKGRGALLRTIAIVIATCALVAGGWTLYDRYAGRALREAAAAATDLQDAVKQLAHERNRRLASEDAATEAAAKLAEERAVVADLRQTTQRLSAELADVRREKDEAVRAVGSANELSREHAAVRQRAEAEAAVAKIQLAEAEARLARLASPGQVDSTEKEELQVVKAALIEANRKIEELQARQLEPMAADNGDSIAENSPCVLAVQGKVPFGHKGAYTWTAANLTRLCRAAEASVEPGKCFEEIMRGKVDWGAGTTWATANALALCGGTRSARRTIDCFNKEISSSRTWQVAIRQCRARQSEKDAR